MSAAIVLEPPRFAEPENDELYEIVDGVRVEVEPMSFVSNFVANRLAHKIEAFAEPNGLGFCIVESLFRMELPVNRMRRPDMAFVSSDRWPDGKLFPATDNVLDVVPDMMAEVVSPSDLVDELFDKIHEYFRAGTRQAWIVLPRQGMIQIFDAPTTSRWLTKNDVLDNLPYLPGFRLPLIEVFGKIETT